MTTKEELQGDRGIFEIESDALERMRKASIRGTGCHLTAEMIRVLGVTVIGELWSRPRNGETK